MRLVPPEIESKLRQKGFWPESWTARAGLYVLSLDIILFALQVLASHFSPKVAASLAGWVTFLSAIAVVLFAVVGFRWLRSQILWRLRNRLIVTYVFFGVIPVVLLTAMSLITLYILAGQFASYIVASGVSTHLRRMETANNAIANELAVKLERHEEPTAESLLGIRRSNPRWLKREVCARYGSRPLLVCSDKNKDTLFDVPESLAGDFSAIVRDHNSFELRTGTTVQSGNEKLRVISSEPLDPTLMARIAESLGDEPLGEITLGPGKAESGSTDKRAAPSQNQPPAAFTVGMLPPQAGLFDREISFSGVLPVVDWATGNRERGGVVVDVQTRPSVLYGQLFAALGDSARGWESVLFSVAIIFAIIVLFALWIGTRLTRSITSAVAQLYEATKHINRADFSHRIQVKSNDQLAALANSFNSMTASIEKLVLEQKEKQRLENELVIAQEVQEQLFPKRISQLESLEVHGFCRPARTVSGDYYDFLSLNSEKMILAVGDVSGKGISAALLMATIHSAVRAYSLEGIQLLREPAVAGAAAGSDLMLASDLKGAEASPATLLTLLNQQLYESTPQAKYATLFLGIYDGATRRLTYSNGGHLPPILISEDGSSELLSCGGTVVGMFDHVSFPDTTVQLRRGDIFLAYSDGVTEPENDYGEFGEERLIQIVRENRHRPLARIAELVTAAVDDWIGDNEQPDDVTLVLARAK
jgi:sigma-B regulation protein RsbU (phosphoserine phosphatase)